MTLLPLHNIAGYQTALLHTEPGGPDLPGAGLPVLPDQSENGGDAEQSCQTEAHRGEL